MYQEQGQVSIKNGTIRDKSPALPAMFDESSMFTGHAHEAVSRIENVVDRLVGPLQTKAESGGVVPSQSGLVGMFVNTLTSQRDLRDRLVRLAERLELLA